MQVTDLSINALVNSYRPIAIANSTLNTLIAELGVECQQVIMLVHQLQLPNISDRQKIDILAELNASIIHLQSHCDDDLQELIADELESITD
jgi:predicted RecB family endonuclease